ncbi:hypothetical protein [Dysosmobacter sp.]|uniref:hypothetical protein n=1 Tax=Dysosmobacter sp. TaxID=2591382 RepID=UPI002A966752|nr:hypothetical protein [Dysosmobacter sp.]MDY5509495.1 hypothetical protein [Dysosmobacter sp.]
MAEYIDREKTELEIQGLTIVDPAVAVLHGHWEYWEGWRGNHDRRIDGATCSVCGYEHPTVYDVEDPRKSLAPLCPVCGTRMDERKKEVSPE